MKKLLVSILLATTVMSFAACGGNNAVDSKSDAAGNVQTEAAGGDEAKKSSDGTISKETLLAHEETPAEDFVCVESKDGGAAIDKYNGTDEIVVIPETIGGEPVVQINKWAFPSGCSVKAVKLADTVKKLDEMAFAQNENLELVVCGSGLETIGDSAFLQCENLSEVELNEGLKTIEETAFSVCSALNSIYVPESVEEIGIAAFGYLSSDNFVLQGKAGSVVETYAQSEEIKFEAQ